MEKSISGILLGKMEFNKNTYEQEFKKLLKEQSKRKYFIKSSDASFKIKHLMKKGVQSLALANYLKKTNEAGKEYWVITICYYAMLYSAKAIILTKGYETDDHYATQIALGCLCVPNEIEKEDLHILEQSHKIFEDDYINYFEDARKESRVSRYNATKIYSQRRVTEILKNATNFIGKIKLIIEG